MSECCTSEPFICDIYPPNSLSFDLGHFLEDVNMKAKTLLRYTMAFLSRRGRNKGLATKMERKWKELITDTI